MAIRECPQNIPKKKGGNNMFYTASFQQVEQLYPDILTTEPEKMRIYYTHEDGTRRFVDRCNGYCFSDKPWGLETEYLTEGIDQEFVDDIDYLSMNIRNSIKAPDGWTFVSCDYAAEELRLGALNTKSKVFMDAFKHNKDPHLNTAVMMFGEEAVKKNKKKLRSIAKGANFGLQYGGSWRVMQTEGVSDEEAQQQYDAYMLAMADHFAVQKAQVDQTHQTLTEYTFFGLPVRLHNYYKSSSPGMQSAGERLAKNHRIQGTGADVLSISYMKLWKNIFGKIPNIEDFVRFQITVHDEIDFIVRNDVLNIIVPEIIKNMQTQMPDWEIPLTVGLSFGPTFGTQYEWKYDPKTFQVIGPDMSPVKKEEVKEVKEEKKVEEEKITIEF